MTDTQWGPPLTGEQMKALRDAGLQDGTEYREETVKACQSFEETVTIAKMTEADAYDLWRKTSSFERFLKAASEIGLVKVSPEPTRAERFWQGKERNSLYGDESARALIDAALEFER